MAPVAPASLEPPAPRRAYSDPFPSNPPGRSRRTAATLGRTAAILSISLSFSIPLSISLSLIAPTPTYAVNFPDTADLKKEYRVGARHEGRPTDLYRWVDGDSLSLHLDWTGRNITAARLEQGGEFEPEAFSDLTAAYGNGAAWHETESGKDPKALKLYPGLQQEWFLKGYGGEKGWLGSGIDRGRFFLVFRETPPTRIAESAGPLRLNPAVFAFLDTSSQWLHVPCTSGDGMVGPATAGKTGARPRKARPRKPSPGNPVCFSPTENSHFRVRVDRTKPLALQASLDEGESGALSDIKAALKSVPDAAQADYSRDLSQMLLGEAQMFLVKFSQRLPEAFTWPSWQLQDFKDGKVAPAEFLPIVRRQANPGDSLPAFRFQDAGISVEVNLYYRGTFHLTARELP